MAVKAVLFDLDGTLLDTLDDLADSMNLALRNLGFPPHERNTYKTAVGDGVHLLAERVLPLQHRTPETIRDLVAEMQKIYSSAWMNKTRPYHQIPALLETLQNRQIRTAVLSNKPDAKTRICVDHYFGSQHFDSVMGASPAFPLKPDPAAVRHILQIMAIPAAEWLYLGDTNTDMQTARNAGIKAVGVTWGFRDRKELWENGAEILIDTPLALIPYLNDAT
ncbi:MAG: HAD family hydrolase [Kiritimatiellia bacterium]